MQIELSENVHFSTFKNCFEYYCVPIVANVIIWTWSFEPIKYTFLIYGTIFFFPFLDKNHTTKMSNIETVSMDVVLFICIFFFFKFHFVQH